MKNNMIIGLIIGAVVSAAISIVVTMNIYKNKYSYVTEVHADETVNYNELVDKEEYTGELPNFNIKISGIEEGTISNADIKNVKVYKFNAYMLLSYGSTYFEYVGVKLKDVLKEKGINDYSTIIFEGDGKVNVTYTEEEITDNVYLIFYRSGNTIGDAKVNMFSFDYMYNYSIENLVGIAIG